MSVIKKLCQKIWTKRRLAQRLDSKAGKFLARLVYKHLKQDDKLPSCPFETSFYGLSYQGDLANVIDYHVFFYGAFEKPLLYFMRDYVKENQLGKKSFVDIGANIGQHSLFMSAYCQHVHAFEPYPLVRKQAQQKFSRNLLKNVRLHPYGLSDEDKSLPFYQPPENNLGIGSFSQEFNPDSSAAIDLDVVKGDAYFTSKNIDNIGLIKIDVEGYEKNVLAGLRDTLKQHRPTLVIEISKGLPSSFASREELEAHLPENYQLFQFANTGNRKKRRRERRDRFSGRYRLVPLDFQSFEHQLDVIAQPVA